MRSYIEALVISFAIAAPLGLVLYFSAQPAACPIGGLAASANWGPGCCERVFVDGACVARCGEMIDPSCQRGRTR